MTLSIATLLAAVWALRRSNVAALGAVVFVSGTAIYFGLLVSWFGSERIFSGASLKGLGLVEILLVGCLAAAITALAATVVMRRLEASIRSPST